MHRDLKIDNILFNCHNKKFVKLIDFGFAQLCQNADLSETKGTPYYMAPEVIRGDYDLKCDLWSIGVITFKLLCGRHPFQGQTEEELFQAILTTDFDIDLLTGVSKEGKKFIINLLNPKAENRMSCEEALNHQWIT